MTSQAPGKLVISGAYAVLRGAPAVVTAVDRVCTADGSEKSSLVTPEVAAALDILDEQGLLPRAQAEAPSFDANPLRRDGRKLGLGSSAAILVASLWEIVAKIPEYSGKSSMVLRETIFELAFAAHRRAQAGGSGVDVAASTHGGTLLARPQGQQLFLEAAPLPRELCFEVWAMPQAASTAHFVMRVMELEQTEPKIFRRSFGSQMAASLRAADALRRESALAFIDALREQEAALEELGDAAEVPIVLDVVRELHRDLDTSACFLPSGAGGGDVSIYIGRSPSLPTFRETAEDAGLSLLDVSLDAPGSGPIIDAEH